jgi:hypothetical protein
MCLTEELLIEWTGLKGAGALIYFYIEYKKQSNTAHYNVTI